MTWVDNDLTKLAGGTLAAAGCDGYAQGNGGLHVYFVDANGHIHELYRSPDPAGQWVDNDLTKLAGATPAAAHSAFAGYAQGDGSQHVNYIDGNLHVREL